MNDRELSYLQPGEVQAEGLGIDCSEAAPAKIVVDTEEGNVIAPSDDQVQTSDFTFSRDREKTDIIDDVAVTGILKNGSERDCSNVELIVLYKNKGKIVTYDTTYVGSIKADASKPFQIGYTEVPEHDSYELFAVEKN